MGKQKQQRRSAKKKGGKKSGAAGQNDGGTVGAGELVKCTACAQLVKPEDTIACPIPECARTFCTQKCAKSCIVSCADPTCSMPKRCRPCASGKTLELLWRRNEEVTLATDIYYPFCKCERLMCTNIVCSECCFFHTCATCNFQVCLQCCFSANVRDEQKAVIHCGSCSTNFCQNCDEGFNLSTKTCSKCAFDTMCAESETEFLPARNCLFDDSSDEEEASVSGPEETEFLPARNCLFDDSSDEEELSVSGPEELDEEIHIQAKVRNEVVLAYAQRIRKALTNYASDAVIWRKLGECIKSTSEVHEGRLSEEIYSSIVGKVAPDDIIPDRVLKFGLYHFQEMKETRNGLEEYESVDFDNLGKDAMVRFLKLKFREEILIGVTPRKLAVFLLPDITSMQGAFHSMEKMTSGLSRVELQTIHLDTMQDLYREEVCGYCLQPVAGGDETKRCGGCLAIRYCDKKCQALSWPVHGEHCQRMNKARSAFNTHVLKKRGDRCDHV